MSPACHVMEVQIGVESEIRSHVGGTTFFFFFLACRLGWSGVIFVLACLMLLLIRVCNVFQAVLCTTLLVNATAM